MSATRRMDGQTLLAGSLLFRALPPADLARLVALSHRRNLSPGEVLFRKGDPADAIYAVLRGSVRVVSHSEDGREVTLRLLPTGEVFGELGLLHEGLRTATIAAGEDCSVLAIGRREFLGLLEQRPKLAISILGALAARIDELTAELSDLVFLGLPARLAKKLLDLARLYGEPAEPGVRIARRVSQQDLANLVGSSRESVNKQLRSWEGRGILEIRRWQLTLRRPATLEALVAEARMARHP